MPALPESLRFDEYPLETGRTWSYQVTWSEGVGADVQSETGTIDLTILNHHELGRYSLVTILETTDLPETGRDRRLLFCLTDGRVVRRVYDAERLRAWLSGGESGDDGAADFVFPLRSGQKWGPPDVAGNPAGYNARDVGAFVEIELPAGYFRALPVRFSTRSDREISWLAPGAGVVRYEYRHFGQQSRELWELKSTRMSPPDSAAIGRLIEERLAGLIREPGFPSRRLGLAGDPTLRALLGALSVSETPEDDDGASRVYLRGEGSLLTLDCFPDGRQQAWLGRWTRGPRLLHVFFVKDGGGATPGERGVTPEGQAPNRPSEALRAGVESARALLLEAARLRRDGRLSEAGRAADRASLKLVDGLYAGLVMSGTPAPTVERHRDFLAAALGSDWLVTRYGRRLRLDDGIVTIQIDDGGDILVPTLRADPPGLPPVGTRLAFVRPTSVVFETGELSSLAIRRVMALDWSEARSGRQCLARVETPGAPGRVDLFILEERAESTGTVIQTTWRKSLGSGSVRWSRESPLLEVTEISPDAACPAVLRLWREEWAPTDKVLPVLVRRDCLNPWMDGVTELLRALRADDRLRLAALVPDEAIRARLEATWLARPSVPVAHVESRPERLERGPAPATVSVLLARHRDFLADNAGPDEIRLRLAPAGSFWLVTELAEGSADDWEP